MLVKCISSEWHPSEKPGIKIGETLEVTDAKSLIIQKLAVAVGEDGEDLDAFDLYGVVDTDLVQQLKDMKAAQRKKSENEKLVAENEKLEKEIAEAQAEAEKVEVKKEDVKPVEKTSKSIDEMSWKELQEKATEAGFFKVGMSKAHVVEELKKLND